MDKLADNKHTATSCNQGHVLFCWQVINVVLSIVLSQALKQEDQDGGAYKRWSSAQGHYHSSTRHFSCIIFIFIIDMLQQIIIYDKNCRIEKQNFHLPNFHAIKWPTVIVSISVQHTKSKSVIILKWHDVNYVYYNMCVFHRALD